MNHIDFSTYKFRSSSLPTLMTKARGNHPLSDTSKAYLREIWIAEVFGREKYDVKNKFCDKGTACESDSLDLVEKVTNKTYFKNKKTLENEWIKGTPDVILEDKIIDIKTSWDIWTFAKVNADLAEKTYYYQLLGYMWMTKKTSSELTYCLVNTPEDIIQDELHRASFTYPDLAEEEEAENKFRRNYIFDDIEASLRVKNYQFAFSEEAVEAVRMQIIAGREYLKGLQL